MALGVAEGSSEYYPVCRIACNNCKTVLGRFMGTGGTDTIGMQCPGCKLWIEINHEKLCMGDINEVGIIVAEARQLDDMGESA